MFNCDVKFSAVPGSLFRWGLVALQGLVLVMAIGTPVSGLAAERNPDRNAYFGEQHIHTSWSVDAWLFGIT